MKLGMLRGFNLYVGEDAPEISSKHLAIEELKLPDLEENTTTHAPGGGDLEIEVPTGLKALESSFKLKTVDPHTLAYFGLGHSVRKRFTAYGSIIDEHTGEAKDAVAVMEGRLNKVETDDWKTGDLAGHNYGISSIWFYRLIVGGQELYKFSFNPPMRVINGVDHYAPIRSALRIPGA